jgi:hypothetical protein
MRCAPWWACAPSIQWSWVSCTAQLHAPGLWGNLASCYVKRELYYASGNILYSHSTWIVPLQVWPTMSRLVRACLPEHTTSIRGSTDSSSQQASKTYWCITVHIRAITLASLSLSRSFRRHRTPPRRQQRVSIRVGELKWGVRSQEDSLACACATSRSITAARKWTTGVPFPGGNDDKVLARQDVYTAGASHRSIKDRKHACRWMWWCKDDQK